MSRGYYVYYRVAVDADAVRSAVRPMQAALERDSGVRGRLAHRDDHITWMEIYEDVADPEAFERALAAAVERFAVRALLAPGSDRHVERFTFD